MLSHIIRNTHLEYRKLMDDLVAKVVAFGCVDDGGSYIEDLIDFDVREGSVKAAMWKIKALRDRQKPFKHLTREQIEALGDFVDKVMWPRNEEDDVAELPVEIQGNTTLHGLNAIGINARLCTKRKTKRFTK